MDTIDTVRLLVELEGEHCGLNHGPKTQSEDYPASDYIVIPVGDTKKEIHTVDRNLVVPVCLDCAQALIGEDLNATRATGLIEVWLRTNIAIISCG